MVGLLSALTSLPISCSDIVAPICRLSLLTKKIFGSDWATNIVSTLDAYVGLSFMSTSPAPEEFDRLLFEFGLELDEDVGFKL